MRQDVRAVGQGERPDRLATRGFAIGRLRLVHGAGALERLPASQRRAGLGLRQRRSSRNLPPRAGSR